MSDFGSLTHSRWDCKYHVVFIPKYCKKKLIGQARKYLQSVLHELAQQRGNKVVEGHKMSDHVHMCVSITPNYSVAQVIGYSEGKECYVGSPVIWREETELQWRELIGSRLCSFHDGI